MRSGMVLCLAMVAVAPLAGANGRFPASQQVVVGAGAAATTVVVRTTFGLFVSRDAGASFAWVCEEALGYRGAWDAPLAVAADGSLVLGLPDGMLRAPDDCRFERVPGVPAESVVDLAATPDGERLLALTSTGGASRLFVSADRGVSFVLGDPGVPDAELTTVDFAPSRPSVSWAIALRGAPRRASLLRSDDGGATFRVASDGFLGAASAWLSAVDPRDPERLWVRIPRDASTDLAETRDGGRSWRVALTLAGPMLGFAVSTDGVRLWAGGPGGLWRSVDGGARFDPVDASPVRCLRHHAGALYVCTDHTLDGVALVRVRDGSERRDALLVYRDAEGSPDCPGSAPVSMACAPFWRSTRESLLRSVRDASVMDVPLDVGAVDAEEVGRVDAPLDGATRRVEAGGGACGCRVVARRVSAGERLLALIALVSAGRRRARGAPRGRWPGGNAGSRG